MKAFSISTSRGWLFLQALLVLVLGLRCPIAWSEELKAGAVRVEITPPVGHQLWGLASRVGPSTGVLEPLVRQGACIEIIAFLPRFSGAGPGTDLRRDAYG